MLSPIEPSRRVEDDYRRELDQMIDAVVNETDRQVVPLITGFESQYVQDAGFVELIGDVISRLKRTFQNLFGITARPTAEAMVRAESEDNARKMAVDLRGREADLSLTRIIGQEQLAPVLEASVEQNVALITSIPDQYFKDLQGIVMRNIAAGSSADGIVQQIQDLTGTTHNRAKLIARDQTAKVNAVITEQRQRALGITHFVWQTAEDNRVRPSHAAKNGRIFEWNDPPKDTGPPGHDINCRCVARGLIPEA